MPVSERRALNLGSLANKKGNVGAARQVGKGDAPKRPANIAPKAGLDKHRGQCERFWPNHMTSAQTKKLKELQWAIESRTLNQRCAVRLYELFMEYEEQWKSQHWSRAAQDLLSVSFSLWRAAFLADKTAKRDAVFSDAKDFLEKLIEDNAISYVQDRRCREWTFNFYTRAARNGLETLHKHWSTEVPAYEGRKQNPPERWRYCQLLLDKAVEGFAVAARDLRAQRALGKERRDSRVAADARRRKSRAITLASRNNGVLPSPR